MDYSRCKATIRYFIAVLKLWKINSYIWVMDRLYWIRYGEKLWLNDTKVKI